MRLRDVCPCSVAYVPDIVYTSGMSVACMAGHEIIISFNYIPKELKKGSDWSKKYNEKRSIR